MTTSTAKPCDRTLINEIEIDAPADAVWSALTTSDGLSNWFPLEARVTPGAGGAVWFSWGKDFEGESTIEIWEPGKRLRTRWDTGSLAVADEFTIESQGGSTKIRLVSQGFGSQEGWDGQYDCIRKGWMFELNGLKHYLERHDGQTRRVAWAQITAPSSFTIENVWERTLGSEGLGLQPDAQRAGAGDSISIDDDQLGPVTGTILVIEPRGTLVARTGAPLPGLLRVELNPLGEANGTMIWVWHSSYELAEGAVSDLQSRWQSMLDRTFRT